MNTTPVSASLLRLCAGLSRVSVRHGSHLARYKKPRPEDAGFKPGHGEKIWVFNHVTTNQIVYSTKPVLDSNKALKQLPFNGKKTKPAKLRKDYWRPMAIIKFEKGEGNIGRSVYQKLREFKRLHELSWGHQTEEFYGMSKKDRGHALNNQKANSVADIAAVLGGAGRGNLIWRKPDGEQADAPVPAETATEQPPAADGEQAVAAGKRTPPFPGATLAPTQVYWAVDEDAAFASDWSPNVDHKRGLILDADVVDELAETEEESPEPNTEGTAAQSQEKSRAS
ncbi:hypothetical protein RB595_009084 [Gaeumannomyces hyphopodioides]